jgi:sensor domain CHASE-containing protein
METKSMKRTLLMGLLLFAAMFMVLGCGQEQPADEAETAKTEAETAAEEPGEKMPTLKL